MTHILLGIQTKGQVKRYKFLNYMCMVLEWVENGDTVSSLVLILSCLDSQAKHFAIIKMQSCVVSKCRPYGTPESMTQSQKTLREKVQSRDTPDRLHTQAALVLTIGTRGLTWSRSHMSQARKPGSQETKLQINQKAILQVQVLHAVKLYDSTKLAL